MREPINIPQTPITEETFKKQGWRKEHDDNEMEEIYQYVLPLPKESKDPYGLSLISTSNKDKIRGIEKGCYVVQLLDCGGLGQCTTEEEIEILYKILTKKSIYA
tara:strand:- start:2093 stop:2404 length:312 start_codon:yes stop_codon:yes gene_type:complete